MEAWFSVSTYRPPTHADVEASIGGYPWDAPAEVEHVEDLYVDDIDYPSDPRAIH